MWFEGPKGELLNLAAMSNIRVQISVTAGAAASWYVAANEAGTSEEHRLSENTDEATARDLCRRLGRALGAETAHTVGRDDQPQTDPSETEKLETGQP
jgi:hypothetical protein